VATEQVLSMSMVIQESRILWGGAHVINVPSVLENEEIDMKAVWNGTVIADSHDTVIVEGNHYFPLASVNAALLEPSTHTSVCPWKGTANYYTLKINDERNVNAVWFYAEPKDAARQIKGRVAFWKGVKVVA
jgi:uncharacterized protein (DUF427 family)